MSLFMVRASLDMQRAVAWGSERGVTRLGADFGYLGHALLTAAFGELAPKPWRLVEPERGPAYLLGYTLADATTLSEHAALYADPAVSAALSLDTIAVKRMPEAFRLGQRLGFEIRLRPVVRSSLHLDGSVRGGRDHRIEIDAALHAALVAREADPSAPKPDAEEVYRSWLIERLARGGARAAEGGLRLVWRRRTPVLRRNAERNLTLAGAKGGGPDIGLAGALEVAEPEAFGTLLATGIGRHRAFGFGMLLLKPER